MKKSVIVGISLLAFASGAFAQKGHLGSSDTKDARKAIVGALKTGGSYASIQESARDLAKEDATFAAQLFRELREEKGGRVSKEDYIDLFVELLIIAKSELSGSELRNELNEFSELINAYFGASSPTSASIRKRLRSILASVKKTGEKDAKKLKKRYASRVAATRSLARIARAAGGFSSGGGNNGFNPGNNGFNPGNNGFNPGNNGFNPGNNNGGNNNGGNNNGGNNNGGNNNGGNNNGGNNNGGTNVVSPDGS